MRQRPSWCIICGCVCGHVCECMLQIAGVADCGVPLSCPELRSEGSRREGAHKWQRQLHLWRGAEVNQWASRAHMNCLRLHDGGLEENRGCGASRHGIRMQRSAKEHTTMCASCLLCMQLLSPLQPTPYTMIRHTCVLHQRQRSLLKPVITVLRHVSYS